MADTWLQENALRLLRETWKNPTDLAQELYTIMADQPDSAAAPSLPAEVQQRQAAAVPRVPLPETPDAARPSILTTINRPAVARPAAQPSALPGIPDRQRLPRPTPPARRPDEPLASIAPSELLGRPQRPPDASPATRTIQAQLPAPHTVAPPSPRREPDIVAKRSPSPAASTTFNTPAPSAAQTPWSSTKTVDAPKARNTTAYVAPDTASAPVAPPSSQYSQPQGTSPTPASASDRDAYGNFPAINLPVKPYRPDEPLPETLALKLPLLDWNSLYDVGGGSGGTTTFIGQVQGTIQGRDVNVLLAPNGPDGDPGDLVSVHILQLLSTETIPDGTWITGIQQFTDATGVVTYFAQVPIWLA